MRLSIPFINGKKESETYFLALLLADEKISAVILQEYEGKLKIVGKHEEFFSDSLEHIPLDEIIDITDKTISRAEEVLPQNVETHKTVFGVKEDWVEKETKKIRKDYLTKLKKLCDSLDLTPVGFMVISEAISNLLQEEEGAPLSAILTEVGKKQVTLTLFRGGNILQTVVGTVEGSVEHTVDRLLKHFTIEVLPARLILYDSETTEMLAQKFISHQWSKSLPFLHMPQISVLSQGFAARAVTHGAGEQMGLDVLDVDKTSDVTTFEHGSAGMAHVPSVHTKAAEDTQEELLLPTSHAIHESAATPEAFGFMVGEDVALHGTIPARLEKLEADMDDQSRGLGYNHVSDNLRMPEDSVSNDDIPQHRQDNSAIAIDKEEEEPPRKAKVRHKNPMKSMLLVFSSLRLPRFRLGGGGNMKLILFIAPVILVILLLVSMALFYILKDTATVTLSVKPNMVNADQTVTFSADDSTDFSKAIIGAKKVAASVDGSATGTATGTQQVGDKAKGTVTIYNNSTGSDVSVSSGTTISSSNGLKFTLDKDVSVASASGDIFSGTKPGTADGSVTAVDIGTDSNLPSGTTFSVNGNSNLAAKNGSSFSGGTKKNVTVVSKNDLVNLKSAIEDQLQSKAIDELTKQTSGSEIVLPVVLSSSLDKSKFDKQAGDQAKSVNVTGTVAFTGLSYNQDELASFAKDVLKNHYAQNVTFEDNSIKTDLKDAKSKATTVTATVHVEAGLLLKINTDDIARQLMGKSMNEVNDILSHLPQVASNDITFSPNLSLLSKLVSRLPNHVVVVIGSNQ